MKQSIRGRKKQTCDIYQCVCVCVCVCVWVQVFKLLVGGYCDVQ